jgi:hypothetical protein
VVLDDRACRTVAIGDFIASPVLTHESLELRRSVCFPLLRSRRSACISAQALFIISPIRSSWARQSRSFPSIAMILFRVRSRFFLCDPFGCTGPSRLCAHASPVPRPDGANAGARAKTSPLLSASSSLKAPDLLPSVASTTSRTPNSPETTFSPRRST